jgi:hypothetical protein
MATYALDGKGFSNIAANTAAFQLKGGRYGVTAVATGTGTFGLQRLALDGVTWAPCHAAFTTGANYVVVDLPAGQYRFAVTTVTAVYADVSGIS